MIIQIVRYKSGLPDEQVLDMYRARSPRYQALEGLKQKFYLRFPATGEYGAVYVWESDDALKAFRESDLGRSISNVYQIQGEKDIEMAEVVLVLRP